MRKEYDIKIQHCFTSEKARLLGVVAGDGHVRFVPDHPTSRYMVSIAAGLDREFAEWSVAQFENIYGAPSSISIYKPGKAKRKHDNFYVRCYRKAVVEDILSFGLFGMYRWRVPEKVLSGTDEIKAAWVSGFAEAEGCAYWNVKRHARNIKIVSVNAEGLKQVSVLLDDLKIRNTFALMRVARPELNASACWVISIHFHEDLRRFRDVVGFISVRKCEKLDAMIASYERDLVHRDVVKGHADEIKRRRTAGETHAEIAKSLGLERETVAHLCYREGVEPEGREGNAAGGTRSVAVGPIERLLPQILALRKEGTKDADIANALGLESAVQVRTAVLRARRCGKVAPIVSKLEEMLPRILAARAEGRTFREIGESFGAPRKGQEAASWTFCYITRAKRRGLLDEHGKIKPGVFDEHRTGRSVDKPLAQVRGIARFGPQIESWRREGVSIREIAVRLDYCEGAVKKEIRRMGLAGKLERVGHAQAKLSEILSLQKQDFSFQEIATHLGLTDKQTVNGVLMWARRTGRIPTEPKANKTLEMAVKVRALRLSGRSWAETAREIGTDPGTAGKSFRTAIERGWIDPLPKTPSDSVGSGEERIS